MSEEYDEILVYLDFNSKVDDDLFSPDKEFKIIGIDTEEPILQLGNQVFQGEWKDSLGTHVMFEEGDPIRTDPLFSEVPEKQMYYVTKTAKMLHMSRIFVNPKGNLETNLSQSESSAAEKSVTDSVANTTVSKPDVT